MEVIPPVNRVSELNPFDRIAGALALDSWDKNLHRKNTRLSAETVQAIATVLDNEQISLLDVLQPKERRTLKDHNQRSGRSAIKSFRALTDSRHSRMLRRHLSDARAKYPKAEAMAGGWQITIILSVPDFTPRKARFRGPFFHSQTKNETSKD
jgi:hypothetical protein